MSWYHKYRPQKIGELDLVSVRQSLTPILTTGEFSHAYLFAGSKGTGKTSSARILAKILNCEHNRKALEKGRETGERQPLVEPCGQCTGCISVVSGTNMAVLELDAASNRGIDDIRLLRERVGLAPAVGMFTVYVIDEVHMLTTEAFNALLKTLEEPPEHAVFVLCTTEDQKIPGTVASRCTVVRFKQATETEIVGSLKKAVKGEGLSIDDAVLARIAQRAGGSFRDAMKVLEQAAQVSAEVAAATVDEITSYTGLYEVDDLAAAIMAGQAERAITLLADKEKAGVDFSLLGTRLVTRWRDQLRQVVMEKPDKDQALRLGKALGLMTAAVWQIKTSPLPSVPLEVAAVEIAELVGTGLMETEKPTPKPKKIEVVTDLPEKKEPVKVSGGKSIDLGEVAGRWPKVMETVRPKNHSLEALLRTAKPAAVMGDWLEIEVYYTFHKEQLEQDRYRRMVEEVISTVMNQPVKCRFKLGMRAKQALKREATEVDNITGSVEDEKLAEAAEEIFG